MSDLMKTKFEIFEEIDKTIIYGDKDEYEKLIFDKLLVLPSGLDMLERTLKQHFYKAEDCELISVVFSGFKFLHGIEELKK